ncbi:hypothetical protein M153_3140001870 [Pseudoloma neurophilia]|uniref:Uncharacterized protein n=1 Tax=Pseudoloma neurophilia TaxID=146866 RepID=A0A0R0LY67_9MICR|nr:hypothetical protein M153_3140001870 [Pseudoloma neurophilia]
MTVEIEKISQTEEFYNQKNVKYLKLASQLCEKLSESEQSRHKKIFINFSKDLTLVDIMKISQKLIKIVDFELVDPRSLFALFDNQKFENSEDNTILESIIDKIIIIYRQTVGSTGYPASKTSRLCLFCATSSTADFQNCLFSSLHIRISPENLTFHKWQCLIRQFLITQPIPFDYHKMPDSAKNCVTKETLFRNTINWSISDLILLDEDCQVFLEDWMVKMIYEYKCFEKTSEDLTKNTDCISYSDPINIHKQQIVLELRQKADLINNLLISYLKIKLPTIDQYVCNAIFCLDFCTYALDYNSIDEYKEFLKQLAYLAPTQMLKNLKHSPFFCLVDNECQDCLLYIRKMPEKFTNFLCSADFYLNALKLDFSIECAIGCTIDEILKIKKTQIIESFVETPSMDNLRTFFINFITTKSQNLNFIINILLLAGEEICRNFSTKNGEICLEHYKDTRSTKGCQNVDGLSFQEKSSDKSSDHETRCKWSLNSIFNHHTVFKQLLLQIANSSITEIFPLLSFMKERNCFKEQILKFKNEHFGPGMRRKPLMKKLLLRIFGLTEDFAIYKRILEKESVLKGEVKILKEFYGLDRKQLPLNH